jgi:hypothetical protein
MFYQPPMEITLDKWDAAVDSQAKAFLVGVRAADEAPPLEANFTLARTAHRSTPLATD